VGDFIVASRVREDYRSLTGPEKAAIFLLSLGEEHAAKLFQHMDDEEIRELSQTMSSLGTVSANIIERLFVEFAEQMSATGSLVGSFESTERLLMKVLEGDKVDQIMEEIRGPAGRTMWDKLGNVNEVVLANYLKNEYPQTVAVVLSKIKPCSVCCRRASRWRSSCVCCAWRPCRKRSWRTSSGRCARSSCRTSPAPTGATRTR
jgi:flagellar motor switch protein FliG